MIKAVQPLGNKLQATLDNDLTGQSTTITVDQVIIERGTTPADELFYQLRSSSNNDGVTDIDALLECRSQPGTDTGFELYRVGDAVSSRSLHAALLDAYRLCIAL